MTKRTAGWTECNEAQQIETLNVRLHQPSVLDGDYQ